MQALWTKNTQTASFKRDFNGLMELYELNYLRLRRLIPDPKGLGLRAISVVPQGLDLHYRLVEQCKYTDTFVLTYYFAYADSDYLAPNLLIRWYRDAQLAEVVSGVLHKHARHHVGSVIQLVNNDTDPHSILLRWRLNRFLFKWLNFCLRQGHKLTPATSMHRIDDQLNNVLCHPY